MLSRGGISQGSCPRGAFGIVLPQGVYISVEKTGSITIASNVLLAISVKVHT